MLDNKQNVFDDVRFSSATFSDESQFQAAARYLRDEKVAGKIAINGGSNGASYDAVCRRAGRRQQPGSRSTAYHLD